MDSAEEEYNENGNSVHQVDSSSEVPEVLDYTPMSVISARGRVPP
jgi:hypothetical protein